MLSTSEAESHTLKCHTCLSHICFEEAIFQCLLQEGAKVRLNEFLTVSGSSRCLNCADLADGWRQLNHRRLPAGHHGRVHGVGSLCPPVSRRLGASEKLRTRPAVARFDRKHVFFLQTTRRRVWTTTTTAASRRTSENRTSTCPLLTWLASWRTLSLRRGRWGAAPVIAIGDHWISLNLAGVGGVTQPQRQWRWLAAFLLRSPKMPRSVSKSVWVSLSASSHRRRVSAATRRRGRPSTERTSCSPCPLWASTCTWSHWSSTCRSSAR